METKKRILIVGAGFAGLKAARILSEEATVDVLLIDRNNYHTFTPLLYQVATCGLDTEAVAYPVRSIFADAPNVNFLLGTVVQIDTRQQIVTIETADHTKIEAYDFLMIAAGSQMNYFGNEHIPQHSHRLRDLEDAVVLRNHILRLLEKAAWTQDEAERNSLMTFVVVGGGATGLETAGALYELYNNVLDAEYEINDHMHVRVILLEATEDVLKSYPKTLRLAAKKQLEELGVEVRTSSTVADLGVDYVQLQDGSRIHTQTVIWSAGVQGNKLAELLPIKLERHRRIPVKQTMAVIGLENVYAAGDIAHLLKPDSVQAYPALIPVAQQQGALVARNIMHRIQGEEEEIFTYFDRGIMATIGRKRAIAWVFNRFPLTGIMGWGAWVILHVLVLMGMRNRAQVFLNWVWNYIFYDRSAQIILEDEEDIPLGEQKVIDFNKIRFLSEAQNLYKTHK
ncbi:MAG: NAD(P)/FAD-dependent oxidoreductase [Anaerolineae bacterium]